MEIITNNNSIITLMFSAVVTFATVTYAILTWRLTSETIKMRKAQTEPCIAIYLKPSQASIHFLDLIIKNIGMGPAYDVTFKILEEFELKEKTDRKISQIDFINEGIKYMPPNHSLETYAFRILGQYNEIIDKAIKIQVSYKNSEKKKIVETTHLNMSQFKGKQTLGENPLNKIAKNIEKIKSDVHNLYSGFHHLKIDTYTSEDRKRIEEDRQRQIEEMRKEQ